MTESIAQGSVRGVLHPAAEARAAIVLAHGASSNCNSPLISALAAAFAEAGVTALRIDLAFRQARPSGPPHPSKGQLDRDGLHEAAQLVSGNYPLSIGGHSYGGRQATMLAAENPAVCDSLLLLSYPLHPPGKPLQLRTQHFPELRTRAMFVHGSRDSFGSPAEMEAALAAVSAARQLQIIERAGHDLRPVIKQPAAVVEAFLQFAGL